LTVKAAIIVNNECSLLSCGCKLYCCVLSIGKIGLL
jgi:hypothetical protein